MLSLELFPSPQLKGIIPSANRSLLVSKSQPSQVTPPPPQTTTHLMFSPWTSQAQHESPPLPKTSLFNSYFYTFTTSPPLIIDKSRTGTELETFSALKGRRRIDNLWAAPE